MNSENLNSRPKTPIRFWILGFMALIVIVLTSLWLAQVFSPPVTEDSRQPKNKIEDGRLLRPI